MRSRFIAVIALIGVAVGAGWYVFAQPDEPALPNPLAPFIPNSVLTTTQLNAIVDRINAIMTLINAEIDADTPQTIAVDCNAGGTITQAFQDADDGDTLQISGTCHETVTLFLDGITLDGQGSAIIDGGDTSVPVVTIGGVQGVTLMNMTIQNGRLGILGIDGAGLRLLGVTVQNATNEGIRLEGASAGFLSDCTVQASGLDGIAVIGSANALLAGTITSINNGNDGLRIFRNASASSLAETTITLQNNLGAGLSVEASSHFADFNSTLLVSNNQGDGVFVTGASSVMLHADISSNIGNGISVQDSSSAMITNASINGNSSNGVLLSNACSGRIENTTISGNGFDGIGVNNGCSVVVRTTLVTNNAAIGVAIEDARARLEMSNIQNNQDQIRDIGVIFGGRLTIDPATLGNFPRIACDLTSLVRDTSDRPLSVPCL
jgi:parallel beta-helix repeat protein